MSEVKYFPANIFLCPRPLLCDVRSIAFCQGRLFFCFTEFSKSLGQFSSSSSKVTPFSVTTAVYGHVCSGFIPPPNGLSAQSMAMCHVVAKDQGTLSIQFPTAGPRLGGTFQNNLEALMVIVCYNK